MKKIKNAALILALAVLISVFAAIPASAYEFPTEFWKYDENSRFNAKIQRK